MTFTQDSKEKLLANEEVKSVGLSCNIKTVKENSKELSLIYYDDDMLSLIPAFDGKYPEKASEIAVTDAFFASENKSPENQRHSSVESGWYFEELYYCWYLS